MNTPTDRDTRPLDPWKPLGRLSPAQHAALHEAARRRAQELRREAIDAFWSALARRLRRGFKALAARGSAGATPRPGRA